MVEDGLEPVVQGTVMIHPLHTAMHTVIKWSGYITVDFATTAPSNRLSTYKRFLRRKTNIFQKMIKNNRICITFIFYHREVLKQARYKLFKHCSVMHTVKKFSIFPVPTGMLLTKLSLAGNKLIISG